MHHLSTYFISSSSLLLSCLHFSFRLCLFCWHDVSIKGRRYVCSCQQSEFAIYCGVNFCGKPAKCPRRDHMDYARYRNLTSKSLWCSQLPRPVATDSDARGNPVGDAYNRYARVSYHTSDVFASVHSGRDARLEVLLQSFGNDWENIYVMYYLRLQGYLNIQCFGASTPKRLTGRISVDMNNQKTACVAWHKHTLLWGNSAEHHAHI